MQKSREEAQHAERDTQFEHINATAEHYLAAGQPVVSVDTKKVLMLELGRRVGRQQTHDVIYEVTQAAIVSGGDFAALPAADPGVTAHLDAVEIARLLDPAAYTGLCCEMANAQATLARETAARIRGQQGVAHCGA